MICHLRKKLARPVLRIRNRPFPFRGSVLLLNLNNMRRALFLAAFLVAACSSDQSCQPVVSRFGMMNDSLACECSFNQYLRTGIEDEQTLVWSWYRGDPVSAIKLMNSDRLGDSVFRSCILGVAARIGYCAEQNIKKSVGLLSKLKSESDSPFIHLQYLISVCESGDLELKKLALFADYSKMNSIDIDACVLCIKYDVGVIDRACYDREIRNLVQRGSYLPSYLYAKQLIASGEYSRAQVYLLSAINSGDVDVVLAYANVCDLQDEEGPACAAYYYCAQRMQPQALKWLSGWYQSKGENRLALVTATILFSRTHLPEDEQVVTKLAAFISEEDQSRIGAEVKLFNDSNFYFDAKLHERFYGMIKAGDAHSR